MNHKKPWLLGGMCLVLGAACSSNAEPNATDATFLRSSLTRSESPQADATEIARTVDGNSDFAFDLYRELSAEEGNLFFSPYSISMAVAQAWAGAAGATESEIATVFHFNDPQVTTHAAMNAIDRQLITDSDDLLVNTANALWVQRGIPVGQPYLDVLALNYGSGVGVVDFDDMAGAAAIINGWVAEQTNNTIQALLAPAELGGALAVLTNAVYLRAAWATPFEVSSTTTEPFTQLDGSQHDVEMMWNITPLGYTQTPDYQAAALPFKGPSDHQYQLLIVLPTDFTTFEPTFDRARLNAITSALHYTDVRIGMPKLELRSSFALADALKAMGMPTPFGEADFRAIIASPPIKIKEVIHQAFLRLDENGVEASAATAVIFGPDGSIVENPPEPVTLQLNRPFLLAIRHVQTGSVLFLGRVVQP